MKVKPDHLDAYRAAHAAVWPDMLRALESTGWRNYSLFLGDDGLLVGYFETDDVQAAQAGMAALDVNARWQAAMAEHFENLGGRVDESFTFLTEVFNLHDQLDAL